MPRSRALSMVLAAAGLWACGGDPGNPFADSTQSVAPRPEADIVFTTNSYAGSADAPRELFAVEDGGAGLARLTFCNTDSRRCDSAA